MTTERQWRFYQSSALPLWVGKWSKASRAADCHFGRRGLVSCGVNFMFKSQAAKRFSTCLLLLATMLRYLDVED
eukprot:scaffold558817_cov142-Attheya_sp.AAC.1